MNKYISYLLKSCLALVALVVLQLGGGTFAVAQQTGADFDHSATGFVLTAPHLNVRCETCHVKGVFKGTPKTCEACHGWNNPIATTLMPTNHIPTGNAPCESCHAANMSQFNDALRVFTHVSVSALSCRSCHDSRNPHPGVTVNPNDATHMQSSTTSCDVCHTNTQQFSGSNYPANHIPTGTAAACGSCHVGGNYQSPAPTSTQIHSNSDTSSCNVCHEAGRSFVGMNLYPPTPNTLVPGAIYRGFQTRPNSAGGANSIQDPSHPVGGDCGTCHVGFSGFAAPLPAGHIPVAATTACTACHKDRSGDYTVMPALSDIHANSLPGLTCVQCHSTANAARYATAHSQIVSPPGGHIPMGAAGCETCHVGAGSSMASTVIQDGDKFSGSLFSHSGITGGCDACHGASVTPTTFYGVAPKALGSLVPAHMPTQAACETCHVGSTPTVLTPANGVSFANAQFTHTGISTGCANCHGPTIVPASFAGNPNIVVMPTTGAPSAIHIPSATTCESCHVTPAGLLSGNATTLVGPGTRFQLPLPTSTQIHSFSDVSSCNVCHESNSNFIGVGLYTRTTGPYTAGSIYHGFQTRPGGGGTYSNPDASHPATGECSTCHVGFAGFGAPQPPSGHIPVAATAVCSNCHTDTVGFATSVSVTNIHLYAPAPNTTNCGQCHSAANAPQYKLKYATVPVVTSPPADHIDMGTAGCETCHKGPGSSFAAVPVQDGAVFSNSLFSHTGINKPCSFCHGVNVTPTTFTGLPNIKVYVGGTGANSHMPVSSQLTCDTCHTNSLPSVLTPATGVSFANSQFSHTGITTDCANCHGPTISPASFLGGGDIVVMPSSAAPGPNSHIPSNTTCENCHLLAMPAGLVNARAAALTGPGTGFQRSPPLSAAVHANSDTSNCATCHGLGKDWIGMSLYPSNIPRSNAPVRGTIYTGFQTRPNASGGTYAVTDSSHTATETCGNCHTSFTGFGPPTMPNTHIPVAASAACTSCHTDPSGDYSIMPAYSNIHKYAPSFTTNCAQCHSEANAALYPMTPALKVANITANPVHMPLGGQACETCHVSSLVNLSTINNPSFANAKFTHTGASTGCAACHTTGLTFQGTSNIIAIPATFGAPGPNSHMPFTTSCETCHSGNTPTTLLSAVTLNTVGNSGFSTPSAPGPTVIHTGATSCNSCHETLGTGVLSDVWMGMGAYPATTSAPFKGFQTRPGSAVTTTFRVQDALHPTGGDCSNCHASFTDFSSTAMPQYHIPTAVVSCSACHTSGNYSPSNPPTLTAIHANAQSTTANCVQCHSAANAAIYNQLVGIAKPIVAPHNGHIAFGNLSCESCHVSSTVTSSISGAVTTGANFKNSAYIHTGVTTGCATCHGDLTPGGVTRTFTGPSAQVLTPKPMPANHVPNTGNAGCEACHTTVPAGLIAFTGGTGAGNTFLTNQYSHKGITTSCSTCHQGSPSFVGISNLVVLPPTTTGNHIPSSTAISASTCEACHSKSTPSTLLGVTGTPKAVGATGFLSPLPTGAEIHNGVTSGCVTCHENPMTWLGAGLYTRTANTNPKKAGSSYVGFQTRPLAAPGVYGQTDSAHPTTGDCSLCHGSTTSFTVSAMPANHIPIASTATCDACHTNISIVNGNADFSQMPTITNIHRWAPSQTVNCAQCHSETNAPKYSTSVVGMTIKSPASIANHVPYGTTACEVCHVFSSAVVNGNTFAGGKYSHTGVTTGCATCHGNGRAANYYTGISNLVAIPVTASQGANSHIPYTAGCEVCHAGSTPSGLSSVTGTPASVTGFRLPAPTGAMIHNGVTSNCNQCHETNYLWKGVDLYPINPKTVVAGANYNGFQTRPITSPGTLYGVPDNIHPTTGDCSQCHSSTTVFTALAKPAGHMPITTSTCSTCHSADYSVAGLSTLANLHTGITAGKVTYTASTIGTKTCVTCHTVGTGGTSGTAPFTGCTTAAACSAPPPLNAYQPMLRDTPGAHVPIGTLDCNGCHAVVSPSFLLTNMMKDQSMHDNAKLGGVLCKDCHENGSVWHGVTGLKVRTPSKHTTTARKAPNNCDNSGCHSNSTVSNGFRMLVQPVMRGALVSPDMERVRPNMQGGAPLTRGSLGNTYDHTGVVSGQCKTCHDGKAASGMPARHLMVTTSCDTCHRPTSWTPAQFSHNGVTPNTCMACHNGMSASSKPPGHFMTARSCDSCHKSIGWRPVQYQHISPQYQPSAGVLTCTGCHITNGEIIPRQMRGLNRTKPIPVGP